MSPTSSLSFLSALQHVSPSLSMQRCVIERLFPLSRTIFKIEPSTSFKKDKTGRRKIQNEKKRKPGDVYPRGGFL